MKKIGTTSIKAAVMMLNDAHGTISGNGTYLSSTLLSRK
jgi:hypothetical protein